MSMKRVIRLLAFLLVLPVPVCGLMADSADGELDIEYAQHLPLVPESLMLDVIASGDRLIAAGERGHIILSDDQGQTWKQAETVPTRSTLTTLASAGGRLWAAGHDTVILTSGDNGETWTRQYFDPERQQPVMDLWFRDKNNGIAIGAYGLMLVTSDGGQSWEDWAVNDEDDYHLNALIALPTGTLLIAGEAGYAYRSRDGGETWESLDFPYGGSMFGAVPAGEGCVLFYGLRGHILRSCDEGDSWEELTSGSQSTLAGAAEQDGQVLLAGNSGTILIFDGAENFEVTTHSSGVDFSAVLGLGGDRYLLTGEGGTHFFPESESTGETP